MELYKRGSNVFCRVSGIEFYPPIQTRSCTLLVRCKILLFESSTQPVLRTFLIVVEKEGAGVYLLLENSHSRQFQEDIEVCETMLIHLAKRLPNNHLGEVILELTSMSRWGPISVQEFQDKEHVDKELAQTHDEDSPPSS